MRGPRARGPALRGARHGRPTLSGHNLLFSGERTQKFQERIAPYVHPSLDYKLHPDLRGRFEWHAATSERLQGTSSRAAGRLRPVRHAGPAQVPQAAPPPQHERPSQRRRYDLQIEGNHTYLVDHVVVHNSPETQPGGRALKFYSSQRLDIRRIETLKEGTEAVGNRVRVKVVKNKVAAAVPPGRVRHRVRPGDQLRGLHPRPRDRAQHRPEVRLVLLVRRRPPGPGPQQRQGLPAREPSGG